jgi:hypothetical protein
MKNRKLMFQVSGSLSEMEAIDFSKTLRVGERHYLLKVFENPNARHYSKRERYVVLRDLREGERPVGRWSRLVEEKKLIPV